MVAALAGIETIFPILLFPLANDPGGDTCNNRIRGNILGNNRARSNNRTFADGYTRKNDCPTANPCILLDYNGRTLSTEVLIIVIVIQSPENGIAGDNCVFTNGQPLATIQKHTLTNGHAIANGNSRRFTNLNSGKDTGLPLKLDSKNGQGRLTDPLAGKSGKDLIPKPGYKSSLKTSAMTSKRHISSPPILGHQ